MCVLHKVYRYATNSTMHIILHYYMYTSSHYIHRCHSSSMYMCTYLMVYDGHCDGVGVLLFSVLQQTENNIQHSTL